MNRSDTVSSMTSSVKRYGWVLAGFWTALVIASLLWNIFQVKKETDEAAYIQAWSAFRKDVLYRRWNSMLGGVYVPVTGRTPPNPYLTNVPERDIQTPSGKRLTLMNPAYMTRLVFELGQKEHGVRSHITSLKPVRPENAPDSWEKKALQAFDLGEKEIYSVETLNGQNYLRLMRPLITERSCLLCHAQQGYKENDIRGGISVTIPMQPLLSIQHGAIIRLASINALFWLLGIGGITFGTVRQIQNDLKRHQDEEALRQARDSLEQQVRERTGELVKTNNALQAETDNLRQTEQMLRASEEKYRELFEQAGDYILVLEVKEDIGLVIADANQAACEIHGYTQEEFLGTPIRDLDRGLDKEQLRDLLDRVMARESLLFETAHVKKDGTIFPIEVSSKLLDTGEYPPRIISIERDITERKEADEALRQSEERYRALFEDSPIETIVVDKGVRITMYNKAKETSGDRLPRIGDVMYKDYAASHLTDMHKELIECIQRKKSKDFPDQNYKGRFLDIRMFPFEEGAIITAIDRTEKKNLETKLQRTKKMESLGLMAGGIAHDLNNILSGIVSYPELLLMDLSEGSPLRKPIETIRESGMRATDVVSDLLTIARGVATGKEVLNLNTMIEECLSSAEHQELKTIYSFIAFKTDLDSDLLNTSCSSTHIKKSLTNLIMNASEAIEGSGTVTISTMNRYLDEPLKGYEDVCRGEYAVLTVSDEGSGISANDLERIFEPFYTKKVMGRSGTGLGLAVVWNTVQDHDGYINVKTNKKRTAFELYFPATRDEVVIEGDAVPVEDYLGHGELVLVIDDEERQREIACGILTKLGYNAAAVSSGEEAVEYLKEQSVDLIVLDMIMLKGINGRETYERIIEIHPGQKAIIASGFSETTDVKKAQKLGAGKYIKKPYTMEKIGLAVKEELEK